MDAVMTNFEIEVQLLLEAIYLKYNYDFRQYAMASVYRRIKHAVAQLDVPGVSALQERLLDDPKFFARLLGYLTVPTSEMFRDPAYFKAIREQVVPILKTYPSLKVWIAGCSSGEELYSFAILFREEGLLSRTMFYATDINPSSLKRAEDGIFPIDQLKKYTQNYQLSGGTRSFSDYYIADYGSAVLDRSLRQNVVFADHSLATDSVFSEIHLVSCRNVLIYFDRELQNRAFGLFNDSLIRRGFMGIGSKETVRFSDYESSFEVFSKEERIYRKQ
jgi:chemotaxis protein methyltransferase CheR